MSNCWTYKGLTIPNISSKHIGKYICMAVKQTDHDESICTNFPEDIYVKCLDTFCSECVYNKTNTTIGIEYLLYKKYITKTIALDFMLRVTSKGK